MTTNRRPRARRAGIRASALAATFTLGLTGVSACTAEPQAPVETLTIGAVLPLTGAAAELGQAWLKGIELAEDRINQGGGLIVDGVPMLIDVEVHDDETTPVGGQRAVQELLDEDVQIFLGPCLSSSFATTYALLKDDPRRLVITPSFASESLLSADNDLLFKSQPTQGADMFEAFARAIAGRYAPERVAMLQTKDPVGDMVLPIMQDAFEAAGAEVVYSNQVAVDTRDFVPILTAIQETEPDLFITPYLDSVSAPLLQQAAQIGFTDLVFANSGGSSAQIKDNPAISTFTYSVTTRAVDNAEDPTMAAFRAAYEAKYDKLPSPIDLHALMFYDPLLMLGEAIEAAGTTTEVADIGAALKGVTEWNDQVLPYTFDAKGLVVLPTMQLVTIKDGETSYEEFDW